MIEITESIPFSNIAHEVLQGLKIEKVEVLSKPHKFAWFNKDIIDYQNLVSHTIVNVTSSAHFIRFQFDHQVEIAIAEDVSFFYQKNVSITEKSQLRFDFNNGYSLLFQVKLYGFILLGTKEELLSTQIYYQKALESISPLDSLFTYDYFVKSTELNLNKGSIKQALATNQHIPGLGNGVLQDVLFHAKMSPKRKIASLTEGEKLELYHALIEKISEMVKKGGRDLQKDIHHAPGGYETLMTNNKTQCPVCNDFLVKEAYLGGKVIYCPRCQK